LYVKCLEYENLKKKMCEFGMCEYLELKIGNWKLESLCEASKIWKVKCLNLDVWHVKVETENWNLKSLCEMSRWNLKFWKLKCLNTESWEV
jgi:hypothetical protein